jgi:hypothetical protein
VRYVPSVASGDDVARLALGFRLAANPRGFFTTRHFDGSPAVLTQLRIATKTAVRATMTDAWLPCAPPSWASFVDVRDVGLAFAGVPARPAMNPACLPRVRGTFRLKYPSNDALLSRAFDLTRFAASGCNLC